ncbi:MAG: hypothetical protein P3W97_003545 [Tepidimonas sp.]|uniref:tetratricopeptide repeat protein n=1 Tax=Tepidimonas sp. TaxID=2002775 RepID=UPI00259E59EB|nr:hypothetical protein [Tepidimonas sp.]MDM7456340.1 hypothetical protein [Tepidimonas sp.]
MRWQAAPADRHSTHDLLAARLLCVLIARAWLLKAGGLGRPEPGAASSWHAQAAAADDRVAQNNLGVRCRDGRGVDRNLDEALRWFKRSADADYPKAQLNLGLLLKTGTGAGSAP